MFFSKLAIKRPVTILMLVLMVMLLGGISFSRLAVDLYPDMELPVMLIMTDYEGAGPYEVESMVTRPLEEVVSTVDDLEGIHSTSSRGNSAVIVIFDWGTDMNFAALDVREQLDMVRGALPDDAGDPMALQMDPDMMPILQIGVTGDMDEVALKELSEDIIENRMERLSGVAVCDVSGGLSREVKVEVDPYKLTSYGVDLEQISNVLRSENVNFSGGDLEEGSRQYLVRTTGEFRDLEEMGNVVVGSGSAGPVFLRDVAEITDYHREPSVLTRMDGESTISLSIRKQADANTIQVVDLVRQEMEVLERELPGNINFEVAMDQSTFIRQSIDNIVNMLLLGGILAVIVLYLFLGNIRSTFIIALAMPISVVATFVLMYFQGLTVNMITMAGLALGLGMMVDNSIVILENIFRYRQLGYSREEAAMQGSGEVSGAITASTLTTMSVFLPVVFVGGMASIIFSSLAWTVAFSLFASLMVALTVIPALSSKYLKVDREDSGKKISGRVLTWMKNMLEGLAGVYKKALGWSLGHRKLVVIVFILMMVGSLLLTPFVGYEFLPAADMGELTANIELPMGTTLEETDRVVGQVEEITGDYEDIDTVFSRVGSGGEFGFGGASPERASVNILLVDMDQRNLSTRELIDDLRGRLERIPGAEITLSEMDMSGGMGPGEAEPINIVVKGDDVEVLRSVTGEVAVIADRVEGTRDLETSFTEGRPELQVRLDRERSAALGINSSQVASAVRSALEGQVVTQYRVDGEEIDVNLQAVEMTRESRDSLNQLPLKTAEGENIMLGEVAEITREISPMQIERDGQVRAATVTGNISGRDLGSVMEDIQAEMEDYTLPSGYMLEYGGEMEEMMEAFGDLALALLLAICLVYMIMASQFESLLYPFVIMFALPQTFIGVVLALVLTGRTLNVSTFMGIIMLAGIVVNNAIVLVDYINVLRRDHGYERNEAILEGGRVRLRPILMTTLTTVLGMLPLVFAIGEGAETWAPMSTAIIGGLTVSTVITLVLVPVVYSIMDDLEKLVSQKIAGRKAAREM